VLGALRLRDRLVQIVVERLAGRGDPLDAVAFQDGHEFAFGEFDALCELLELFERRGVALISVAESLDTSSAAGRLVITIMGAVSQWEL